MEAAKAKLEGGRPLNGTITRGALDSEKESELDADRLGADEEATGGDDEDINLRFVELPKTPLPPKAL